MKSHAFLMLLAAWPLSRTAAAEAPAIDPSVPRDKTALVGNLGRTRDIRFAGNRTFSTETLRRSLATDISFVLASHPSEPIDALLPVISGRLRLGYLHEGFPEAKVRAALQPGNDREELVVTIDEGPRYRQGEIVVTGSEEIDHRKLAGALKARSDENRISSQVAAIRKAMAPRAALLPAGIAPDPGSSAETLLLPFLKIKTSARTDSESADWQPGEPVEFKEGGQPPLEDRVRFLLAEQGRPLARFTTSHVLHPGGTADLRIDITHAGPLALIGTVKVSGAVRNTGAEIRRAAGLEEGQAFLPRQLDQAMLALWRTGRFLPFDIDLHPRGGNSREIDLHIRVCELEKVPPLATPATPEQQCALKFIDWINGGMDGGELLVDLTQAGAGTLIAGWSHQDGLFFSGMTGDTRRGLSLSQSPRGVSLLARNGNDALPARLELPLGALHGWCHILAQNDPQPMSISFGVGFSSSGAEDGSLQTLDLLITPAYAFLKQDEITRDGGTVVIRDLIRLDAENGRLTGIQGGAVRTTPGSVRELQEGLDREIKTARTAMSAVAWVEALCSLMEIEGIAEQVPDKMRKDLEKGRDIARLIDLAGGSGVLAPIADLFRGNRGDDPSGEEKFFIPVDPADFRMDGMLALAVSAGSISFAEKLLPDAEWASVFARELLFLASGKTTHTRQVMKDLLADPAIGPIGSLACAILLDHFDPALSRRFLRKAADQGSAEAFRKDWRLFVGSKTTPGECLNRVVAGLRTLGPEQEAEAASLLPDRLGDWLRDFLDSLRQHPAEQPLDGWITPAMDRLWNDHLDAWLRQFLEGKIPPPADPREVAATVDDVAIPRAFVRLLQDQNRSTLRDLPLSAADESRPWTRDPVLATAVRATLAMEEMRRTGRWLPDEEIQKSLDGSFPELAGKDDADWLRETGMNRQQLRHVTLSFASGLLLQQQFNAEVGQPEEQDLHDHFKDHARLFRGKFSSDLVFIKPVGRSPKEQTRCHRLASAIGRLPSTGLPMMVVKIVADEDPESGCAIYSQADTTADSLQPLVLRALEDLEDGQASGSMELGTGVAVVVLRKRKEDPAIGFDQVKEIVTDHWKKQQADTITNRWFAAREEAADIRVVGPTEAPAESSAFADLLAARPGSKLGLLGEFWLKTSAGDQPAADAALERLLGAAWEDAGILVTLVEPLANKSRRDLALRCLQKAASANPAMTRRYMDALVNQHAGHGCELGTWLKDQRDRLPKGEGGER